MEYLWDFAPQPEQAAVTELSASININPTLASILVQRGITTFDQAKAYFRPSLDDLHDPFLMKNMEKAVNRLSTAIHEKESLLIFGDYDVDGSTSVAVAYGFLQDFTDRLTYYIPDRYKEGYGVSWEAIEFAKKKGIKLIITIDCGVKAVEKIEKAASYGIDVIVCDHHRPGKQLPPAFAILDPKQEDCSYPYDELCGCGVAFKLLQGFCQQNGVEESKLFEFLDLVAVATSSDIVPITGENRALVHYGIEKLNKNPRPGLKALIDVAGYKNTLTVTNIVFGIGPRINAAGRIDHAHGAVQLLLSENIEEAHTFADKINDKNNLRRDFDASITEEALTMIAGSAKLQEAKSTVLYKEDWHKGVIGIVASRCIEHFYRPTIILTKSNDKVAGSARSVEGFDVYNALSQCTEELEQFGGHMYAAGLTLEEKNVSAFQAKFEEVVSTSITEDQLVPKIKIDSVIPLSDITTRFYAILHQMGPFGPKNMQPVFVVENVVDAGGTRIVKEKHLKVSVKQEGVELGGIAFGLAAHCERIKTGEPFHLCFTIEENHFNGITSLQLMVKDIKFNN